MDWKWATGYEGCYKIFTSGEIQSASRSVIYNGTISLSEEKILKPSTDGNYFTVTLSKKGKHRKVLIHRLILETFIGPCPTGKEARHLDGDPSNNKLSNLEWGTPKQNGEDRIGHGTQIHGEKHHKAILTKEEVEELREYFKV